MNRRWAAHLFLAIVQLNNGVYHVLTKFALNLGANQLVFCTFRDLLALFILGPLAFFVERKTRAPLDRWLMLQFLFLGATGIFLNQLLFLIGLSLTSPAYASALQPGIPVFAFVLALANGTENANWRRYDGLAKVGGLVLSVCGAVLMSLYKGPVLFGDTGSDSGTNLIINDDASFHLGILCLIGNCFFMAVYVVFQAPVLAKYPYSLTVTAWSYFFGTVFMVSTGLASANRADWTLTKGEGYAVLYAGVFASALNYFLLTWSNSKLGPSLVSLYMPLQPLASSTLACIFLNSPLYLGSVLGGLLIVAGLYCVTWGKSEAERLAVELERKHLLS